MPAAKGSARTPLGPKEKEIYLAAGINEGGNYFSFPMAPNTTLLHIIKIYDFMNYYLCWTNTLDQTQIAR